MSEPKQPSTGDSRADQHRREAQRQSTKALFKILKALSHDVQVTDGQFRIAFRVAQAVNAKTDWAEITDAALIDEIPRTDRKKLRMCRRNLERLGWWRTIEGERGQATRYLFLDTNVPAMVTSSAELKDKRDADYQARQIERVTALQAAAMGGNITPLIRGNETISERAMKRFKGGRMSPAKGAGSPPLLPQTSTSEFPLPTVQDVAPHTHEDRLCAICDSPTTFWHSASGNWICEKHRAFADEVAASLTKDEDGFVDIVPESPAAKAETEDEDFDDDIPEPSALRGS